MARPRKKLKCAHAKENYYGKGRCYNCYKVFYNRRVLGIGPRTKKDPKDLWINSPEGRAFSRAKAAKRRALKLNATPTWSDLKAIRNIYENCPDGYHVDHIIPLINNQVCGLHVPWNLQYLPASENLKKGNKF